MIIDIYQCPACGALVDKIYRINVITTNDPSAGFQVAYACQTCFKPTSSASLTVKPLDPIKPLAGPRSFNLDLLQQFQDHQQPKQEAQEQADLIEAAKEQIRNKAVTLGIDADSAYKKAYHVGLEKDTDISRLDRYNEKLSRQIAAAKAAHQAGLKEETQ